MTNPEIGNMLLAKNEFYVYISMAFTLMIKAHMNV